MEKKLKFGDSCAWCQPNEDGEYTIFLTCEDSDGLGIGKHAIVSFYNGTIAVDIKFCPFCGRKL